MHTVTRESHVEVGLARGANPTGAEFVAGRYMYRALTAVLCTVRAGERLATVRADSANGVKAYVATSKPARRALFRHSKVQLNSLLTSLDAALCQNCFLASIDGWVRKGPPRLDKRVQKNCKNAS